MKEPLTGKTALITGASAGIGRATAKMLAREGANIALTARRETRLQDLADSIEQEYTVDTLVLPADIRNENKICSIIESTVNEFDTLDILVNNAGIVRGGGIHDFSTADYRAVMETNIDGVFFCTREALPHLEEVNGHLIFIGSFDSKFPRSENPVYAATKWWIRGFAHSVEAIVGENGVAVTLLNPSKVRTEISGEDGTPFKDRYQQGDVLEPEDIANAVAFAVRQKRSTISELDIFARDKFNREGF